MRPAYRWFAPDLALVAAAVTLFYCLFLFQGYRKLFRDSDAGWHIRTGESILDSRVLPRTDPYSFSRAGQPWFAWEWGADVVMGATHRVAGLGGVALFYSIAIAACTWLWIRLHWTLQGNFLLACAMTPLMLSTASLHWLARPHVLGWLFLLTALLYAESPQRRSGWPEIAKVAAFAALWANVHASFFFAAAIALIYAIGRTMSGSSGWSCWSLVAAAALGPLANPYGWDLYRHVSRYLTDAELMARIGEFQSFDFHAEGAVQVVATLMLAIAGGALAASLGRFEHAVLAVAFSALALRSARGLPLAALLLLPIANAAITETLKRRGVLQSFLAYGARLRLLDGPLKGLALVPVVVVAAGAIVRLLPAGFPPEQFPVAAYEHLPMNGRLFAPDKYGGYLIYRSNGSRKVFFDGRSDFYGADFLKQYGRMVQVRPGWREQWETFRFTHALVPDDAPLIPALESMGWKQIYRDGTATLLSPSGT